jgi:hypothetical protein
MAERKKFLLRISHGLWEELNRWAAQEFRSVNGQIEFILQRAVRERRGGRPGGEAPDQEPSSSGSSGSNFPTTS